ncbi:MAG: hypothetical protein ACP5GW_04765, partial [Caldisericaceae bacterium]
MGESSSKSELHADTSCTGHLISKKVNYFRDLILLLEVGAFFHDIGKLSSAFIASKVPSSKISDLHGQILFIDRGYLSDEGSEWKKSSRQIPGNLERLLFAPINQIVDLPPVVNNVDISISLSHLVCAHHNCTRCLYPVRDTDGATLCPYHRVIQKNPLIFLLRTVDHLDASNPSDANKQPLDELVRDNFIFPETRIDVSTLDDAREHFYTELEQFLASRDYTISGLNAFVKQAASKYFVLGLSETRKFGNDITLLDHSKSVAAYYKAYLHSYFVDGKPLPESFFEAHFRILSVESCNTDVEKFLSNTLAMSNLVARTDNKSHFLTVNTNSKRLLAEIYDRFSAKAYYGKTDDFSPLFSDTLFGTSLGDFYRVLANLHIKEPEDIKPGYTKEKALADIKKVIYFALLQRKELIQRQLASGRKHLANLEEGSNHDEKNFARFFRKKREVESLFTALGRGMSVESIKAVYGWQSSHDAAEEVYDFFNEVLSPIRPPSPVKMSKYLLKDYLRHRSFKRLYMNLLVLRPIILARVYAFFRVLDEFLPF